MVLFKSKYASFIHGVVLLILAAPASAEPARADFFLSPGGHPASESIFVPPFEEGQETAIDHAWYTRTGAKKGLSGAMDSKEERDAAADTAVLARGFAHPWKKLLAGQQEPHVLAGPEDLAALSAHKKLLIIPTGALSGTAESGFFRAGIEEFARAGGVVFCLAQRSGRDYSVLPAPSGNPVQGAGWAEDTQPLFRSSSIRMNHPLLSGLSGNSPVLETQGYIKVAPPGSRILLARNDSHPTLILYPLGRGWIVIASMFTDFSSLSNGAEADELVIIKNLLAWSKNAEQSEPDAPAAASSPSAPGKTTTADLPVAADGNNSGPQIDLRATVERKGSMIRISFDIMPSPRFHNESMLVRAGGQEKNFILSSKESTILAFDIPLASGKRISYKFYRQDGRSIARGSAAVPESEQIGPENTLFSPGQTAAIRLAGIGKGELGLTGIGYFDSQITSGNGSIQIPLPAGIPRGTYRMEWRLEQMQGQKQGEFGIDVAGASIDVEDIAVVKKRENGRIAATASIRIRANQTVSGTLRLGLRGPGGEQVVLAEPVLSLTKGSQIVPVPFAFSPKSAGIWELTGNFMVRTPDGAGLPQGPVTVAAGSTLFDVGDTAILSAITDKPFYYEPGGSVTVTAVIFGSDRKNVRVLLDDREISDEKVKLAGTIRYNRTLPSLEPGTHNVRVEAECDMGIASRELTFIYGFLLPDLIVSVKSDKLRTGAQGPEMPLALQILNQGRSQAPASRIIVYDGDPARGGTVIQKNDVPLLGPGERHSSHIDWALYRKAGKHAIFAAADANNTVKEAREQNNTASLETEIPELLLTAASPEKTVFAADEMISVPFSIFNLGTRPVDQINVVASVSDSASRSLSRQNLVINKIAPAGEKRIAPAFSLASPGIGSYTVSAAIGKESEFTRATSAFSIGPTLSLMGSFEETPSSAVLCRPFTIDYSIKNSGNILPSSGTIGVEIVRPGTDKPLFSKQFPVALGKKSVKIESLDLPAGSLLVRLTAKAESKQHAVTREMKLVEQTLAITGRIETARLGSAFPRILVWIGREGRLVEQAVSESIVKQAFEQEDVFYKLVDSEEAFSTNAMTGMFNTYVLFEPEEPLKTDWLKNRLERGQGVIVIGAGETAQAMLREFGFSLEDSPSKQITSVAFSADSGLDLSGTLPVSGKVLSPRKRGAALAATYAPEEKPAVLIEKAGKGRLIAMPLSVSRSASSGATAQYSLALRKMALFVSPEKDDSDGPARGGLLAWSKGGPARARITGTFPEGSELLWSNLQGKCVKNTVTFDLELDREPRKLLYIYRTSFSEPILPQIELSYDCNGTFVDQGRVE